MARRRQVEPPRLIHLVRGDLDWIVMKCLEKDRTRRFETAGGLATDIQRHLGNEPVSLARNRLDKPRLIGIVPKRFTDLPDCGVKRALRLNEDSLAPNLVHGLFVGDQATPPLNEQEEQFKRSPVQLHRLTIATQLEIARRRARGLGRLPPASLRQRHRTALLIRPRRWCR